MTELKPEWRHILECRNTEDKLAIPVDCDIAIPGDFNFVAELVREKLMVWIDRTRLPMIMLDKNTGELRFGINVDVYQLTLEGIKLCNDNGIRGT